MKLTKNQINKIRELKNNDEKVVDIAKKLKISISTVSYWTNEESRLKQNRRSTQRFKSKTLTERRKIYRQRLPYLRDYQYRRYNDDETFREKQKRRSNEYYKRVKKNESM